MFRNGDYEDKLNLNVRVLDFVQSGEPNLMVGSTTFEVLFTSRPTPVL